MSDLRARSWPAPTEPAVAHTWSTPMATPSRPDVEACLDLTVESAAERAAFLELLYYQPSGKRVLNGDGEISVVGKRANGRGSVYFEAKRNRWAASHTWRDADQRRRVTRRYGPTRVIAEINLAAALALHRPSMTAPKPPKKHRRPWTARESLAVERWVKEGATFVEIAERIGRTARAVESEYRRRVRSW